MVRNLGFSPVDYGALENARQIEDIPHRLFPQWWLPLSISFVLWWAFFAANFFRASECMMLSNSGEDYMKKWSWDRAANIILHVNKATDSHALALLSLFYLPGNIAGYFQLIR